MVRIDAYRIVAGMHHYNFAAWRRLYSEMQFIRKAVCVNDARSPPATAQHTVSICIVSSAGPVPATIRSVDINLAPKPVCEQRKYMLCHNEIRCHTIYS